MAEWHSNIDLVFRNGLKDYEVLPPEEVWDNITPSVNVKKRRIAPVFSRAAAVVVIVASAATATYFLYNSLSGTIGSGPAVTFNQETMPSGDYRPASLTLTTAVQPVYRAETAPEQPVPVAPETVSIREPAIAEITISGNATERKLFAGNNPGLALSQPALLPAGKNEKVFDIVVPGYEKPVNNSDRWKLGASVLPSYYSRFNFSSNDAAKDYISSENAVMAYSGGVSFSYDLGKRVSLQAGVVYSSMGQRINGITSFSGFKNYADTKTPSDFEIRTASGTITSVNKDIYFTDNTNVSRVLSRYTIDVFDPVKANLEYVSSSLIQTMSYIEMPVILRYKVIDRRIDVNMLGGVSYSILVGNSAWVKSGGVKYIIGTTDGLSSVTLSSSLGMGLEYKLSESFTFNVEPVFRYYITPLGGITGSAIHPYSFGILSGLFYNF